MAEASKPGGKGQKAPTLYFIIAFKLFKGLVLVLLALGVYKLTNSDLPTVFREFLEWIKVDPEKKFFTHLEGQLEKITPSAMLWVARGTMLYSLFSLVEGIGLIFRVRWAGWLAIGESAFFIPIEMYELAKRPSLAVFVLLGLNILIVCYLFKNRDRLFKHH